MELQTRSLCQLCPRCNRPLITIFNGRGTLLQTLNAMMKFLLPQYEPKPDLTGRSPPPQWGSLELCSKLSVCSERDASQQSNLGYPDLIGYTDSCHRLYFYKLTRQFMLELRAPSIHNSIKTLNMGKKYTKYRFQQTLMNKHFSWFSCMQRKCT
jgi:hypothetical protein